MLETAASAQDANATVLAEILGGWYACEAEGLAAIRDDGDGLGARDRRGAAPTPSSSAAAIGMIVAHGNGTPQSDVSEAGGDPPRLRRRAARR
jgi:3-oxoacyl-(acyl-carrier-protein) synthase